MYNKFLWTQSFGRLELVRTVEGSERNWVFIPGGPGMGSEYLIPLIELLTCPGNLWRMDFPGDGSNTFESEDINFSMWKQALIEVASSLNNPVLVGHSSGGMFMLDTPELNQMVGGVVLLSSAPDKIWSQDLGERFDKFPLPEAEGAEKSYIANPSNETLKELVVKTSPRMFCSEESIEYGKKLFQSLPINYAAVKWSEDHFDPYYQKKWVPEMPTLILSGDQDLVVPLEYFLKDDSFNKDNIHFIEVSDAGHFPWVEKPTEVIAAFDRYADDLS